MTCENLNLDELKRLMLKEKNAMPFSPNVKAFKDTRKHYLKLKKEYDRRLRNEKRI